MRADERPLAGKRIAVTRRSDEAIPSAELLARAGAVPVLLPAIRLAPLDTPAVRAAVAESATAASAYTWRIFVSTAAVDHYRALLPKTRDGRTCASLASAPPASFETASPRTAAIGPATAERVAQHLGVNAWLPTEYRGGTLGASLPVAAGDRVCIFGARAPEPALAAALRARGVLVEEAALYATVSAPPPPNLVAELGRGLDAVTFASPSAVRGFVAMAGGTAFAAVNACIGASTASAAAQLGLRVDVMPVQATFAHLVDALIEHYSP